MNWRFKKKPKRKTIFDQWDDYLKLVEKHEKEFKLQLDALNKIIKREGTNVKERIRKIK